MTLPMRALSGIVAAGVVLAGVLLWRLTRRSPARWIVAALTAYGAVALTHAMLIGLTLRAALAGDGLFQALPRFLQGAFVGALFVLPLGWIASVVRAGIPRFREGSRRQGLYQVVALSTCLALVIASLPLDRAALTAARRAPQSPADRAAQLDRSLQAIEDGNREIPRDRWDPGWVIANVGRDPQDLFAWVQENTDWIPYHGVLRGAVGVLMDGQGNSLDRSLLLATLLEKAGHPARLAHGQLSIAQANDVLPALVADRAVDFIASPGEEPESDVDLSDAASRYHLDRVEIAQTVAAQGAALKKLSSELSARVADQTTRLLADVPRPDALAEWKNRLDAAVEALRDHWWVQQRVGTTWTDFDLLEQDGAPLTAATTTTEVGSLDDDLFHAVTVRVIAEQSSGQSHVERTALEHRLRPMDLFGRPLAVQFAPIEWQADSAPGLASDEELQRAMLHQEQWWAGLQVGRDVVTSTLLLDTGADPAATAKGGDFGGMASAFARSMGVDRRAVQALSAVWLEYDIHAPGQTSHVVRRTVFDLIGPAARAASPVPQLALDDAGRLRRGLSLTMRTEILPIVCQLAPAFVAQLTSQSLIGSRDLLRTVTGADVPSSLLTQLMTTATPPVTPLLGLAFSRLEWSGTASHVFIDRPNILTRHQFLAKRRDGIVLQDAVDIVANDVGVELGVRDAFAARVEQGVRDTNAEALLAPGAATGNTGQAYAASREWQMVAPSQRAGLDRLNVSADTRRRIAQDLNAGFIVVVPSTVTATMEHESAGWWRIDASTGDALGVGANGWGQSLVERGRLTTLAVTFARSFLFEYGLCQSFPQAVNSMRVINEELFGGWNPSWTKAAPKAVDPLALADANHRMCLKQAIAAGFIATLPLLLMTIRFSRTGRMLAFAKRSQRRPRPANPCGSGGPTLALVLFVGNVGNCFGKGTGPKGTPPPRGPRDTDPDPRVTQHDPHSRPPQPPEAPPPQPRPKPQSVEDARKAAQDAKAAYDKAWQDVVNAINEIGAENELRTFGKSAGPRPPGGWDPQNPPKIREGTPHPDYDDALRQQLLDAEKAEEAAKAAYEQAQRDYDAAMSNAKGSKGRSGWGSSGLAGSGGANGPLGGGSGK